eukprot:TRINITY_DN25817_c0_g1_i2.p1 TRINITY_DN25817_c0_g1~~TRINITY_DN25817_c0_g1_i2.p1  ORF type:complete len:232 (+),score=52.13 TRINITY_DN25817_c0_g1_i2:81-776(+)
MKLLSSVMLKTALALTALGVHSAGVFLGRRAGLDTVPEAFMMVAEGVDCSPGGQWIGTKDSAESCAHACRASGTKAKRFIWAIKSDKNCKCVPDHCLPSARSYGAEMLAMYRFDDDAEKQSFNATYNGYDCLPSSDWLGGKDSATACARACKASDPKAVRFVWGKQGQEKNCKCASRYCSPTVSETFSIYQFHDEEEWKRSEEDKLKDQEAGAEVVKQLAEKRATTKKEHA